MERHHQDCHFVVTRFNGLPVEALWGVIDADKPHPDDEPIVVYLKVPGHTWQRFFVDAGAGVWESHPDIMEDPEDDSVRMVDYAQAFHLQGKTLESITCTDGQIRLRIRRAGIFALSPCARDPSGSTARVIFGKSPSEEAAATPRKRTSTPA